MKCRHDGRQESEGFPFENRAVRKKWKEAGQKDQGGPCFFDPFLKTGEHKRVKLVNGDRS